LARKAGLCSGDESPVVETLGGRVSNVVLPVRARRGAWVVKRALSQLPGEGGMACGQVENLHGERVSHADPRLDEGSSCAGGRLRRQRPLRLRPRVFGGRKPHLEAGPSLGACRLGGRPTGRCHPDRLSLTYAWERECAEPVPGRLELLPASPRPLPGCHRPPPSRHQARRFHCRTSSRGTRGSNTLSGLHLRAPEGWGERSTSSNASERWIRSLR